MDNHHAAVVGSVNEESDSMKIIAHVKGEATSSNSSENASNNQVKTLQGKFFKEIASHMVNATHIHVTGTGQVQ